MSAKLTLTSSKIGRTKCGPKSARFGRGRPGIDRTWPDINDIWPNFGPESSNIGQISAKCHTGLTDFDQIWPEHGQIGLEFGEMWPDFGPPGEADRYLSWNASSVHILLSLGYVCPELTDLRSRPPGVPSVHGPKSLAEAGGRHLAEGAVASSTPSVATSTGQAPPLDPAAQL